MRQTRQVSPAVALSLVVTLFGLCSWSCSGIGEGSLWRAV